jgi:y4mF family transcriptional regulator
MNRTDDPERDNELAVFVRQRRRKNGLTQRQLSELAGVGIRVVSELERGKATLRLDVVSAIVRVFGMRLGVVELRRARGAL